MEKKNGKGLIVLVAIICVVIALVGGYSLGKGIFTKKEDSNSSKNVEKKEDSVNSNDENKSNEIEKKDNIISDEEAKNIGKELYNYAVSTLVANNNIIETSKDNSTYLYNDNSNKCNFGIGCIQITNWEQISRKYTTNFVNSLDYKNRNDKNSYILIVMIDSLPYVIDGAAGYELESISNIEVLSKNEDTITFKIESKVAGGGLCGDGPCKDEATSDLTIKLENSTWKIDKFSFKIILK